MAPGASRPLMIRSSPPPISTKAGFIPLAASRRLRLGLHRHNNRLAVRLALHDRKHQRTPHPPDDGKHATHNAFAPIATCFQFVPSLTAMHATEPVPPAVR